MSIKFLCPHCKKVLSVKDQFAGKRAKCPKCDKVLTVPAPAAPSPAAVQTTETPPAAAPPKQTVQAAAPPPPPDDLEALAAAALVDQPKADAAPAPTTIDFTCPMCDAELHMPLELGGKREPCPECRRIIKVPMPAVKDPTDWRKVDQSLPSGAKRAEEKPPEGAWGATTGAASTLGTLREAGVISEAKALLTVRQKIVRYTAIVGCTLLLLVGGVLGYLKWLDVGKAQALRLALDYAESDQGKKELGRDGRAAVYRLAGEYLLRTGKTGCADDASKQFGKSLGALREASDPAASATEHDALLQDLALAEVELGGAPDEVEAALKLKWDDVQKQLHAALADMHYSEPRMETLRELTRRLCVKGEGNRAAALASSLYSTPNEEKAEALGEVALELMAAKKSDLAASAAGQALQLYKDEKDRPALAPAAVALAVVLNVEPPPPAKKGSQWFSEDEVNNPLGQVEGLARQGQWDAARQKIPPGLLSASQLRAYVAIAEAARDDKTQAKSTAEDAVKAALAPRWSGPPPSPWLLLRLARLGERAGVSPESLQALAALLPDRDLRGRAQLAAVQAQLAPGKQVDPKVLEGIEPQTLSVRLAREALARHNAGPVSVVRSWDAPNRAFGFLGFALSGQGE